MAFFPLTACGGGDDEPSGSPSEVLDAAKTSFDETPGVELDLTLDGELPSGVSSGVLAAEGTLTHQPAFDGSIKAVLSGFSADVPVIAVDGKVYADIPLLPGGMQEIDPDDYDVPDPSTLADPDTGISAWMTAVESSKKSGSMRDGNKVLTTYSGSLPGAAVETVLPSADEDGTFDAEFNIDSEGLLRVAKITGPIYEGASDVTYVVTISKYGIDKQISAP